ncbi:hypothetical protein KJ359_006633 [Pestalotiopsis sp. 9143b]|nr:hypothetical protein KJ359_006633 [Pestalotiopsis sp. 9143b]
MASASVLLMPAVDSNPPNSTYEAEFLGPLITCGNLNSSESAIMGNIVNHTSAWYQSLGSSGAGVVEYLLFKPDVGFMDPAGQPNETFDYYNFIGSITNTSRNGPDGAVDNFWAYSDEGAWSCHTSNATFQGKFTTHLEKQDITVDDDNTTLSPLGDYSHNWSDPHSRIAYEMIVRMIFSLLEGAIVHDLRPDSDPQVNAIPTVFRTSIMQTGLIGALNFSTALATGATKSGRATTDKPIITPEDESLAQNLGLGALIEQLSRNVTMSFFSDTQFW